jgi:hypothetical protein
MVNILIGAGTHLANLRLQSGSVRPNPAVPGIVIASEALHGNANETVSMQMSSILRPVGGDVDAVGEKSASLAMSLW